MRAAAMEEGIEFAVTSQQNDGLWLHTQDFVEAVDEIFGIQNQFDITNDALQLELESVGNK